MTLSHRPLEATFQRKVIAKLRTLQNCWYFKASDRVRSGVPDIIISLNGQFIALELKRDEKSKPSPLQLHTINEILDSGATAMVVSPENWDEIWKMLQTKAGDYR